MQFVCQKLTSPCFVFNVSVYHKDLDPMIALSKRFKTSVCKIFPRFIVCPHLHAQDRCHKLLRQCWPLHINWSEFITNVKVFEQAEVPSTEAMLLKYKLRWAGHVSRIEDHRLPYVILCGELSTSHRDRGAPKKHYKDCLKKSQCSTQTATSGLRKFLHSVSGHNDRYHGTFLLKTRSVLYPLSTR